jgi:hypothetical protein
MELEETFLVLFPVKEVLAMIKEISDLQLMLVLLNLRWFLACQIPLIKFTMAAVMTILHLGDQFISQIVHISSMELNCKTKLRQFANQDHSLTTKSHSKKR